MQYHLNGFKPGDPHEYPRAIGLDERPQGKADILIVGCGPAGLTLAAQLAQFPDIHTRIFDQKSGPLMFGQADGIACRSVEMFEAFGFSERVLRESYWVNETTFWGPSPDAPEVITRTGRIQDVADDLSEMPHVILSQARMHDFFLDVMRLSPNRLIPDYNWIFRDLSIASGRDYPVTVRFDHDGKDCSIDAKFVIGCDGAHSAVRRSLGLELDGEAANKAWGVMDVLVDTGFPDIRFKSVIRSAEHGNILIIPREGGYLVRLYVEMETLSEGERVKERGIRVEDLIGAAQRILHPYNFDVKEVAWWSVYEIAQRLCAKFDNGSEDVLPNVFIAGDACHTHSPKAGQGMNVSMGDAFNLGWKLASVLRKQSPGTLLATYSSERRAVAQELIEFDRHWAREFSERGDGQSGRTPTEFQEYFADHGRYTAGVAVAYAPSMICGGPDHQFLAEGYIVGMRFHSAPVIRLWDGKPMQLGHCLKADGRWRLMLFNDQSEPNECTSILWNLCDQLAKDAFSPLRQCTSGDGETDQVIDIRAVFQQPLRSIAAEQTHPLLAPKKGRYGLTDREKMFCADPKFDIFERRKIDRSRGCLLVVRPDQYVAKVMPLGAYDDVVSFFADMLVGQDCDRSGTRA